MEEMLWLRNVNGVGEEFETDRPRNYCNRQHYNKCKICGKEIPFSDIKNIPTYCSPECRREGIKQTKIEKYGSANNSSQIQKSIKEKYGDKGYFGSEEGKKKIKETNLQKYGNVSSLHGDTDEAKRSSRKS